MELAIGLYGFGMLVSVIFILIMITSDGQPSKRRYKRRK
jgi:hypothetical protein